MLSLQEKQTAIQIEKICKIIDSTNDFNRLEITYAFHSLFQSSLVCTCICNRMFSYIAWHEPPFWQGELSKGLWKLEKKTKTKTSKPYLCRCLKLVFFGSQVQGTPVNVKIQTKAVRIDFLLSFDSQWENCENLLLLSFLDGRLPLRNNFYTYT